MSDRSTCGCCSTGFHCDCDKIRAERDAWKDKADKLAEAMKDLLHHGTLVPAGKGGQMTYVANSEKAKTALEEMNILDNELVKKYFGDFSESAWVTNIPFPKEEFMALRVLQAMQEPIRNGDKVLQIHLNGEIAEQIVHFDSSEGVHTDWLRLPDKFQKKEQTPAKCGYADCPCSQQTERARLTKERK